MERVKICRYCQKEFTAKRIDAKYCSDSCRQMGYRREANPEIFGKVVPVYFELDDHEYAEVLKKAHENEIHPNEYAKRLLIEEGNLLRIFFSENEWSQVIVPLRVMYENELGRDISVEKLVRDVFLKAARKEINEYAG